MSSPKKPKDKRKERGLRDFLKIYGPAVAITVVGFVIAYQFVEPAPPDRLVIATGPEDGAYFLFAQKYRELLAEEGVSLDVRSTSGAVENLQLLREPGGEVAVAFVQGGVGEDDGSGALQALGSLYHEPLWIFTSGASSTNRLSDLKGQRLAVGPEGSGTRAVALLLLEESGIGEGTAELLESTGTDAARSLREGKVDAVFLVASEKSPVVRDLLRADEVRLMNLERSEAYAVRHPFLSRVRLPEGVIDFQANLPPSDVILLSPTASLVAREDLHPALIILLLMAAEEVHARGGIFEAQGEFPRPSRLDFPLSSEARRFFRSGPPFLLRYLPFWAATLVDRLKVLLVPLLTLLFPLFKVLPPVYRWRIRSRIYRWYRDLREVELKLQGGPSPEDLTACEAELDRLQREVSQVEVPLSYAEELYHLRLHIALVRDETSKAGEEESR